jgi:hypothetical protein
MEYQMNGILRAVVVLHVLVPLYAFASDDKVLLELNTIEPSENRCRLNFVIENRSEVALDVTGADLSAAQGRHTIPDASPKLRLRRSILP